MIFKLYGIFLVLCLSALCTASAEEQRKAADNQRPKSAILERAFLLDDSRNVIAGDVLSFQVFEDEEPRHMMKVIDSGVVDLPYVGRYRVEGKTCKQIAGELKQLLEESYYYKATVFIGFEQTNPVRGEVYVIGEVNKEGSFPFPANKQLTLSMAILKAGGLTSYAKEREVKIVRKKEDGREDTTIVDVREIFEKGNRDKDALLQSGDMIIVPKSGINF